VVSPAKSARSAPHTNGQGKQSPGKGCKGRGQKESRVFSGWNIGPQNGSQKGSGESRPQGQPWASGGGRGKKGKEESGLVSQNRRSLDEKKREKGRGGQNRDSRVAWKETKTSMMEKI